MRSPDWSQGSHRTATGIALPALTLVAGCSSGPTDAQLFAADRAATALRAQVWAEYLAAARAARQVRVDGGFPDLGVPTGGSLYPCPSPITAPIWPQPGEYSPRQEYAITLTLRGGTAPADGQETQLQAAISDLELGLRHEGFGHFSRDSNDNGFRIAWQSGARVEVSLFSDFPDYPPAGVCVLLVSRCARFDPAALPDLTTRLAK